MTRDIYARCAKTPALSFDQGTDYIFTFSMTWSGISRFLLRLKLLQTGKVLVVERFP